MPTHTPTPEQQQAIDLFHTGRDLVIEAGAGTGKTTTLAMIARSTDRSGAYLAFNRAIAADARQAMPMSVDCRTVHSLAMSAIRRSPHAVLLDRLGAARMSPMKVAHRLGLGQLVIQVPQATGPARSKVLQPSWQASHVMRAVAVFCQSADPEPGRRHFPYVEGIDSLGADGRRGYTNNRQVAAALEGVLHDAWDDLTSPTGQLRFTHDVYLKLWQLGRFQIPAKIVFFDEAQDASPVMLAALAAQEDHQTVYVGDTQQQIYEWRGAVNALAAVSADTQRTFLTQSWRFGQPVADVANAVLGVLDADLRLTGNPHTTSTVHSRMWSGPPRAVLCRTNGAAVNAVLQYQAKGMSPHLVGGSQDIVAFAHAAASLQAGGRTGHPELACFESWAEVQRYVEDDPQGGDLRMMVKLLDDYGTQIVLDALEGLLPEPSADIIISTAHRAKGREWPAVRLATDFDPGEGHPQLAGPEWRLLYVAATRARHVLDISGCRPLRELLGEDPDEPVSALAPAVR